MRYFCITTFFVVIAFGITSAQIDTTKARELSDESLIFLDGVHVNKADIEEYDPTEIAFITVVKSNDLHGPADGRDAIYVYTKKYSREQYWNYFKSKSRRYGEVIPSPDSGYDVVYILNGAVLEENIESVLFDVNDSNFIDLEVIDEKELKKRFKIKGKKWGVAVKKK
jgi:hypothetical protein